MGNTDKIEIKEGLKILKPREEVFEAIVDPKKMSGYFISSSSGRMESGKTLIWQFPEFDMQFPVGVETVEPPGFIAYYWSDPDGSETKVEFTLRAVDDNSTFVSIIEKSRENDEKGIAWLRRNTEGSANFLVCLKAYLEYGINLRKGAFDISQLPQTN